VGLVTVIGELMVVGVLFEFTWGIGGGFPA
jgi:hypothetical protein